MSPTQPRQPAGSPIGGRYRPNPVADRACGAAPPAYPQSASDDPDDSDVFEDPDFEAAAEAEQAYERHLEDRPVDPWEDERERALEAHEQAQMRTACYTPEESRALSALAARRLVFSAAEYASVVGCPQDDDEESIARARQHNLGIFKPKVPSDPAVCKQAARALRDAADMIESLAGQQPCPWPPG